MKLNLKYFFFVFSLFIMHKIIFAQTDDVISIKNQLNSWMKAYNQKDLNNSVSIFAEDYIGFYAGHPDQNIKSIKQQNDEVFKNKYLKATLSMEAAEIETSGDLAYVSIKQKWAFKPSVSNKAQVALEKGILILKKQSGGVWKIIRSSTFPVNALK